MTGVTTATTRCLEQIRALEGLLNQARVLPPFYRKVIAELVLVRLAIALENCLSASFYRIVSGTDFESGRAPMLHSRPATIAAAEALLKSGSKFNWLNGSDLCAALSLAFDAHDPCLGNVRNHSSTLADVRKIRNHVAHRNRTSGPPFRQVVRRVYGQALNSISPGTLLLTLRNGQLSLCKALLVASRVMVREIFEK